jgi:hypothetical protein
MNKPNYTQTPNIFYDSLLSQLGHAEMKCLLYIFRRTFGFHRKSDKISLTQFEKGIEGLDSGTGLSRKNIHPALESLAEKGIININKEGNTNSYSLYLDDLEVGTQSNQTRYVKLPKVGTQGYIQKKGKKERKKDTEKISEPFVFEKEVEKLNNNKRRDMQVIGWFMGLRKRSIKKNVQSKAQLGVFIKRYLRTAGQLKVYTDEQLVRGAKKCARDHRDIDWTMETILKTLTK